MEAWIPLMKIFLNSPTPESEASTWFHQSTINTSSSSSSPSSFISLLTKPADAIVADSSTSSSSSSSPPFTKRVMWIQTLPCAVQSRILAFLLYERSRFCSRDLSRLAMDVLKGDDGVIDFWVKKSALQLFDSVSDSGYEWISGLSLDFEESCGDDEFESVPSWLKNEDGRQCNDVVLPWLPLSPSSPDHELNSRSIFDDCDHVSDSLGETEGDDDDDENESLNEVAMDVDIVRPSSIVLDPEIDKMAAVLKTQIIHFESKSKTVTLAREIHQLCLGKGNDSLAVMGLMEPWKADDETTSVLLSHLVNGTDDEEPGWAGHVLCSVILPKFLVLGEPTSRVLLNSTIEYCKLHEKEAVRALLLPLIYRAEGINSFICDVITRIIKECLHFAHVSAFCHQLLCGKEHDAWRSFICLPCHQCLVSNNLVWTESMFNLIQNILNHNVQLTQDSVDHLVYQVNEMAERFSKSLKFGNFLLCFVTKCSSLLKPHKLLLTTAVGRTNSLLTKSVLAKLMNL